MNNFSLCLFLIIKETRSHLGSFVKNTLMLSLVLAIVITLYIIPESYRFMRVAPYEFSKFDIQITGLLFERDYNKFMNSPYVDKVVGVSSWGGMNITNTRNQKQQIANVDFVKNIEFAGDLLPYNKHLFKQGNYKENCAVITVKLANRLGIKLNDSIVIDWSTFNLDNYEARYTISGILYETAYGNCILADKQPTQEVITKAQNKVAKTPEAPDFSYLYLKSKHHDLTGSIQSMIDPNSQISAVRAAILADEIIEVNRLADKNFKYEQYGLILLYLIVIYGYSVLRLKQKRHFYAILTMLGATPRFINLHILLENILLFLVVTVFSVVITFEYC